MREVHAGVSCYEGELVEPGLFRIQTNPLTCPDGIGLLIMQAALDLPAVFLWGEQVGRDPAGEPLLRVSGSCPAPKMTEITAVATFAQPALKLWSRGPRDGSGGKVVRARLTTLGSEYLSGIGYFGTVFDWHSPGVGRGKRKRNAPKQPKKAREEAEEEVSAASIPDPRGSYGSRHWRLVAAAGLALLEEEAEADEIIVFLFALFHDSKRYSNCGDPYHGRARRRSLESSTESSISSPRYRWRS